MKTREDAGDGEGKDAGYREKQEDGEQPQEKPVVAKSFSSAIDPKDVVPADPSEEVGRQEVNNATEVKRSSLVERMRGLPPLPFQMMSNKVLQRSIHGVFWVCFPPKTLKQSVKKYASVFNEVASSPRWKIYPFCYLDTRDLDNKYKQHLCDDISKITFVMEKSSAVASGNKHSTRPQHGTDFLSSWKFKRVFGPDQTIKASLVEDFLNDVHTGKLPEVMASGDL